MTTTDTTDSVVDRGEWLVAHLVDRDRGEAAWLVALARFDAEEGWAADGMLSGAQWLMYKARMSRATAYEKLQIGHQLLIRPLLREAFVAGRISYSAARLMARMDDPDPDVDAAVIAVAETGTITDVERVVRLYLAHADQDLPPVHPNRIWDFHTKHRVPGATTFEITVPDLEAAEIAATLQAFLDVMYNTSRARPESAMADSHPSDSDPADESATADIPLEEMTGGARKAHTFMDLVRTALTHAGNGTAVGADRYMIHIISHPDGPQLLDGTPLDAATVACDASSVAHHTTPTGETLSMGRKTRDWSTAIRRAALIRDGGQCRYPGCQHRQVELHHIWEWDTGGSTNLDNAMSACSRHHHLIHRGYRVEGHPDHALHFYRPDGTRIGTTTPRTYNQPWKTASQPRLPARV